MSLDRYPVDAANFDGPVLVTGAGGCIGAWVLALLARADVPVVAFDLVDDKQRPKLLMPDATLDRIPWETGDIADTERVMAAVNDHGVKAIIHLAALQVPFCKADPVNGAKVNVLGTVNILEAARAKNLKRVAFASSIAAHSFFPDQKWLPTLYGAYKYCDEMIAKVYAQDWGVPSVGIRPGIVYGIGRDQGMTSKTTVAILAAAAGKPYNIPFSGPISGLHAGEVASAFIAAVAKDRSDAVMFDHNGVATTVEEWASLIRKLAPGVKITVKGDALPFPAELSDKPIQSYLGEIGRMSLDEGIKATFETFQTMLRNDIIAVPSIV